MYRRVEGVQAIGTAQLFSTVCSVFGSTHTCGFHGGSCHGNGRSAQVKARRGQKQWPLTFKRLS